MYHELKVIGPILWKAKFSFTSHTRAWLLLNMNQEIACIETVWQSELG